MKGHMEKDGFHPHTEYKKGTRKSRDQKEKTQGVRLRRTNEQNLQIENAFAIGEQAFEDGKSNVPAGDKNLNDLFKRRKVGDPLTIPQLKAWSDGWWNGSKKLENYEKNTALDFIKRHPNATIDNLSESTDIGDPDRIVAILELYGKVTTDNPKDEFPQYRIKEAEAEVPDVEEEDDREQFNQTIIDQLHASRVNGFPFFAYTGLLTFVLKGNDTVEFNKVPRNPNHIEKIVIKYDQGQDLYNVMLFKKNDPTPIRTDGVFFDMLADIIVDEMGVR